MNIPQGYKQTELGIIPEDWEVKKICEGLADVKSGKRLPSGYYVTNQHTKHPYIRVIDMYDGGVDTSNLMYVPDEAYKPIEKYRIFKDDIFISVAGTLGIVGKIPEWLDGANLTENANRLTNITCNRDYLLYYLRSPYIQDVISSEQTIGAQPKLALMRIRNFDIALPKDIAEQRAIAEALSDVDGLIAALDKKTAKKRLLKQGAMQQLLTGKKRLPGFTDEWIKCELLTVCNVLDNKRVPLNDEQRTSGIYPYCGANGIVDYIDRYIFDEDLILIAEDGGNFDQYETRPIAYWMSGKYWVNNHAHVLKAKNEYNQRHIFYQLEHKDITDYIVGGTRTKLTRAQLDKIEISMPSTYAEQQAIATILSDMDKEIADLEAQRDKYRLLKSGMMQKLLTGQIRFKK
ncbi:MAG: restriction endonuclease subunit S [Alistipes sp.]|nr:restriction endonuclease subunit S [Alistipes sp.]